MTPEEILTLIEHGGLAVVLWILLTRVLDRLDVVTDHLIKILEEQSRLRAEVVEASTKSGHSDV